MAKVSLSKDHIKFLLLEGVHPSTVEALKEAGYSNIDYRPKALDGEELKAAIADAHFIGIRSRTHLTAEVLAHAKKLIAIGCFCIGTNQVNLKAAAQLGIPVFNAPFSNTRSVAELVIAEMILLMRNLAKANMEVHRGLWNKSAQWSNEIRGKKLGIIGYGHIGSQVSIMAESLGMKVYFYDLENKLPLGNAQQMASLQALCEKVDILSLHVPENDSTKNMINSQVLSWCKEGSILINAARGTVVDIEALCQALDQGKLRGAAIDVFPIEPASTGEEFVSPLRNYDNVLLTPHIGGSTAEAQENIGGEVAQKFIKYSDNGSTVTSVNFPEVSLPTNKDSIRLMHIHHNQPGVLNAINKVFVDHNINIAGQFLATKDKIGYVVVDVDTTRATAKELIKELQNIDGTIKSRLLY